MAPVYTMTIAERSELIIDETLTVLEKPGMAMLLQGVPYVRFAVIDPQTQKPTGEYKPGAAAINAKSIEHVCIDTGDGKGLRYFTRVNAVDNPVKPSDPNQKDSLLAEEVARTEEALKIAESAAKTDHGEAAKKSVEGAMKRASDAKANRIAAAVQRAKDNGFRASAWLETNKDGKVLKHNGKPVLRFSFPGFEKLELAAATGILLGGEFNPQVHAVPDFIQDTLAIVEKDYGLKKEDITTHVACCSMGTSNGLAAQACLLLRGIACNTLTAGEPFCMKLAHEHLKQDLKTNGLLTQNICRFPVGDFINSLEKTLLNPDMDSTYYHAYRTEQKNADGTTTMSRVAGLGGDGNKSVGKETRVNMTGYENVTENLWLRFIDPLHMNGSIVLRLVKINEAVSVFAKVLNMVGFKTDLVPHPPEAQKKEERQPPDAPHPGLPEEAVKPSPKINSNRR